MFRNLKNVMVELNTPKGSMFSGYASSVELQTTDGVIAINPHEVSYLNLTQMTRITLRFGAEFTTFILKNAAGSLQDGQLTIIAEEAQHEPEAPTAVAGQNGDL